MTSLTRIRREEKELMISSCLYLEITSQLVDEKKQDANLTYLNSDEFIMKGEKYNIDNSILVP